MLYMRNVKAPEDISLRLKNAPSLAPAGALHSRAREPILRAGPAFTSILETCCFSCDGGGPDWTIGHVPENQIPALPFGGKEERDKRVFFNNLPGGGGNETTMLGFRCGSCAD